MTAPDYDIVTVEVEGSDMDVFLFKPPGNSNTPLPGIVLAQHIPVGHAGLENDTFTLTTARRLATNGYVVAVPFIFHWWAKSESMETKKAQSRDDWMLADVSAAFEVLARQPEVDDNRIAMAGHCWGGRVAWLAACYISRFRALAVFYGGNIKKGLGEGAIAPIDLAANIACPVIGFFGNEDSNPSPQDVADYAKALEAAGIQYEFHQYDNAGHAFQNFPAEERYNEVASEDAWAKVLEFFDNLLK